MTGHEDNGEVAQRFAELWTAIQKSEQPQDLIDRIRDALDRKADILARQQPCFVEGSFAVETIAYQTETTQILKVLHRDLGTLFAIKTMPEERRGDALLDQRLRREAEIGLILRHDCLQETSALLRLPDGRPALLQPWAPTTLAERLNNAPVSTTDIRHLLRRIIHAISAMHAAGYIHCDISAANILLPKGTLASCRLGDFAIALKIGQAHSDLGVATAGSPDYAAPEQLAGAVAHPSQDIYAIGRLAERLLSAAPIEGNDHLAQFSASCVAEQAEKRPQTAGEALKLLLKA